MKLVAFCLLAFYCCTLAMPAPTKTQRKLEEALFELQKFNKTITVSIANIAFIALHTFCIVFSTCSDCKAHPSESVDEFLNQLQSLLQKVKSLSYLTALFKSKVYLYAFIFLQ
uniref:Uncharacterized protein n=1 Tax=Poecilia latipinna TaxID=48699 RepID=A0A3B3UFQ8_9TELE